MNYRTYKYWLDPTYAQRRKINSTIAKCYFLRKQYKNDLSSGTDLPTEYKLILSYYLDKYENLNDCDNSALMNEVFKVRDERDRKTKIIKDSYTTKYTDYMEVNYPLMDSKVYLPKIGYVRKSRNRHIGKDVKIRSFTVMRQENRYFLLVNVTLPSKKEIYPEYGKIVGFDYSSTHFIVDNNGKSYDVPHFYRWEKEKIVYMNKYLRTKNKGSFRYRKIHREIQNIHKRIHNRRFDVLHKLTSQLAEEYDCIAIESLEMKQISTGHNLADATYDNSYYIFTAFLGYKMEERGKKLIKIDKWFPSTKKCSACGYVRKDIDLDTRTWICPECRTVLNRDINAAVNIRNEGIKMLDASGRLAHH